MSKNIAECYGWSARRSWLSDGFGEAVRLVKESTGIAVNGGASLEAELLTLVKPHLPVLAHKRSKVSGTRTALQDAQWYGELDDFVARSLLPRLADSRTQAERNQYRIIEMVDEIVASAQQNAAQTAGDIPYTSRFDASWAM